ncbi:MAG: SDR family oxidoreductase [Firmicutes bacterium]|nr:SDR family oxidoreductase [Bacillota bacterium]
MGERLAGKFIVVTGATSGLGWAMADALLREGATVAVAARPTPRLDAVVNAWKREGVSAVSLSLDVRDPESVEAARDWIQSKWPHCDMVVNNAGLGMRSVNPAFMTEAQPFFEVTLAQFDAVMDTNLRGYFLVSRAFSRLFLDQGFGRFVNISMNHATMTREGFVPYGPSRAGAEALSYIMAHDLKRYGITVNLLLPGGATATGMIPESVPQDVRARLLPPEVMGPPIVFLASDAAEGMTGERIEANAWHEWRRTHQIEE